MASATVADWLSRVVDDRTAAVLVSSVFFENGHIARRLGEVLDACQKVGAELLVDVVDMVPDRAGRDEELLPDVLVGSPLEHEKKDLFFPGRQVIGLDGPAQILAETGG